MRVSEIKKEKWISAFKREIPFFQTWLADTAFTLVMKENLGWGFTKTINIVEQGIRDSYYAESDEEKFLAFLKKQLAKDSRFTHKTNARLRAFARKLETTIGRCRFYENRAEMQKYLERFERDLLNMLSLYRFPVMVDLVGEKIGISKRTRLACGKEKDYAGKILIHAVQETSPQLHRHLSRHLGASAETLAELTPKETAEIFATGKVHASLKKAARERKKMCVLATFGNSRELVYRKRAETIRDMMYRQLAKEAAVEEIKGNIAYKGKVRGRVRVIVGLGKWGAVKEGEVLVTPMTTLDSTPYLKRLAAIVTDEGGITCHAAIISRELKVPCIIGTKFATKVLKDGDLVEVNANKGVVRVLKRKK